MILGTLEGRPTQPDSEAGRRVVDIAVGLAEAAAVVHDVSTGGTAVAVAEICIASGIGAIIDARNPAELFSEDPHRIIVVAEPGSVTFSTATARQIGVMGGDRIGFGGASVALTQATDSYRRAIPRRMAH